jgi:hypothetical protein
MKLIVPLIFIFFSHLGYAFQIESITDFDASGDIVKNLKFNCRANEIFCQNLCENKTECTIAETICQDCMSPKEQVVYSAFNEITTYLKTDLMGLSDTLITHFFKTRKFISLTHNSFLNYFNPEEQESIQKTFNSLCRIKSPQKSLLLAVVNENKSIQAIIGAACTDQTGNTVILPMINNPNFTAQPSNFWQNLAREVKEDPMQNLRLKLSFNLSESFSKDGETASYRPTDEELISLRMRIALKKK